MYLDLILPMGIFGLILGVLSSFMGVGGGSVMVPVMSIIFLSHDISPDNAIRMALGSSLAVNLLVNSSSVFEHMLHGSMRWERWRLMFPCVIFGAFCGSNLASYIPAMTLKLMYASSIIATSCLIFKLPRPRPLTRPMLTLPIAGILIGVAAGLLGLAGSMFCIIFFACTGLTWLEAVCTGTALGLPICAAGTIGYIMSGQGAVGLPEWCLGYISLPAVLSVSLPGILTSVIASRLCYSRNMPLVFFRKCYSAFALVMAVANVFINKAIF